MQLSFNVVFREKEETTLYLNAHSLPHSYTLFKSLNNVFRGEEKKLGVFGEATTWDGGTIRRLKFNVYDLILFHTTRDWRNTNQTDCAGSAKQVTLSVCLSQNFAGVCFNTYAPRD